MSGRRRVGLSDVAEIYERLTGTSTRSQALLTSEQLLTQRLRPGRSWPFARQPPPAMPEEAETLQTIAAPPLHICAYLPLHNHLYADTGSDDALLAAPDGYSGCRAAWREWRDNC
ncbi:hypothetical protein FXF51_58180 [Nonomuraea sp. PA05]|nr:hypothetical protein FXF51_58180 [Nonomuraea sp. PA05]